MTDTNTPTADFDEAQHARLSALLDTILPASADGRMPSAAELDFMGYLTGDGAAFAPALPGILDRLDAGFADWPLEDRLAAIEAFAAADPQAFDDLLFRVYACYYQDDRVRGLIGSQPGPPFPRGNTIPVGDLSGLADVVKRSPGYRRV